MSLLSFSSFYSNPLRRQCTLTTTLRQNQKNPNYALYILPILARLCALLRPLLDRHSNCTKFKHKSSCLHIFTREENLLTPVCFAKCFQPYCCVVGRECFEKKER